MFVSEYVLNPRALQREGVRGLGQGAGERRERWKAG